MIMMMMMMIIIIIIIIIIIQKKTLSITTKDVSILYIYNKKYINIYDKFADNMFRQKWAIVR